MEDNYPEIRSEEVQEILGTPPNWLVRWGGLLALITIVIIGWLGYIVEYPDAISAEVKIFSTDPPHTLVVSEPKYIDEVIIRNRDSIPADQALVVFRNRGNFNDVLSLENQILQFNKTNPVPTEEALLAFRPARDFSLGEMKGAMYSFLEKQESAKLARTGQLANLSVSQMQRQIKQIRSTIAAYQRAKNSADRRLSAADKRLLREKNLVYQGIGSNDNVRIIDAEVKEITQELEAINSQIAIEKGRINSIQQEINGYKEGSKSEASQELKDSFEQLQRALEQWKSEFMLISPIEGVAYFLSDKVRPQQYIPKETELIKVIPSGRRAIRGRVALPLRGSGKVQPGQKVIIRLESFPAEEFGAIIAEVGEKAQIAIDGKIPIELVFPNGLRTTTNRTIEPAQEMTGTAEIITENKRFIEWVFEGLRKVWT